MSSISKVDCHGKTFVLSRVVGAERVAIVKYITEHGGEVTGNLDGKVDYLIYRFGGGEESIQFRRIEGKIGAGEEIGMLPSSVFRLLQGITYIGGYYDDEQEIALFYLSSSKEWLVDAKDFGWIKGYVFDRQMELAQILMDRDMVAAIARMMPMVEKELAILVEEGMFTPYEMVRRVDEMLSYANDHQCGAEVISWLLNYKNSHYDSALLEDAEADALDYELELRDSFLGERFPNATLPRDLKDEFHASDLQGLSVGSHVVLGLYPQGKHRVVMPIDWVVVAMEDHRALLVSRFYLYNHCYHEEYQEITWKDCSLRKNLNQDFYGRAFHPQEQEVILETEISNEDNPLYKTKGCEATKDRIFVLSYEEFCRYCGNVKGSGIRHDAVLSSICQNVDGDVAAFWWLRTPGVTNFSAVFVDGEGLVPLEHALYVHNEKAVRPAMWIRIP